VGVGVGVGGCWGRWAAVGAADLTDTHVVYMM
jgi:hypothetical protein